MLLLLLLGWSPTPCLPQGFSSGASQVPQGSPFNNSWSENVDFADVDLDGDWDASFADGGDFGNDQNRLWVNAGFAQGGTLGFFLDQTSTRFPAVLDQSRDTDFVDFDADGDPDLFITNTSQIAHQPTRWWANLGGLQGGSPGFYSDQSATRWLFLGVNNGTTHKSSISPAAVLAVGFIDWSCDASFADLDGDGDMDLVQSTYGNLVLGKAPSRVFLNDGLGFFEEFNPSGFQLTGTDLLNGSPGLWAEGIHVHDSTNTTGAQCDVATAAMGIELADLDGDLDVDLLLGEKYEDPRIFENRSQENGGALSMRDVTYLKFLPNMAPAIGSYEQELGDMDGDGDLDLYGDNWAPPFCDSYFVNDGSGAFSAPNPVANSCARDQDTEYLDYDLDGDIDVLIASQGQERLYRNDPGLALVEQTVVLPAETTITMGAEQSDLDGDGDFDFMSANHVGEANELTLNDFGGSDSHAPVLSKLEQAPDREASAEPTRARAWVLDNCGLAQVAFHGVTVEYRVNGGALASSPARHGGGQVFRADIPGALVGLIEYRFRAEDDHGNTAVSPFKQYQATPCSGTVFAYCTSKVSSQGCMPVTFGQGAPSLGAPASFSFGAGNVDAGQNGILFFGTTGQNSAPFQDGFLCVQAPLYRLNVVNSGGAAGCQGSFTYTLNDLLSQPQGGGLVVAGAVLNIQAWYRDPPSASTTGLSNGLQLTVCP
jgi:hypothetical protein